MRPPTASARSRLQGDYQFNRVGICDLDGDGVFDYVIKQPGAGRAGPGTIRPSPDTYKLEAYNGRTGAFMWRYDLGWNMNMGVWWTPYITRDFDGDGKSEVALKMAPYAATREEAVIAKNGFVLDGPEYHVVLNGMTGKEITRADWVERGDRRAGATTRQPCQPQSDRRGEARRQAQSMLVARGTYTVMYVDAWNLIDGKLVKAWRWFGDETSPRYEAKAPRHARIRLRRRRQGRDRARVGDHRRQRKNALDQPPRPSRPFLRRRYHPERAGP